MSLITPQQLLNITPIVRHSSILENTPIDKLLYDSRLATSENSLFFAMITPQNNGHKYIEGLCQKGVKNFVISQDIEEYQHLNGQFFQVKDVVRALQDIAAFHRGHFNIPVLAITGSNGKTIVKEWAANLLGKKYNIVKNPNSFNSQIGVPVSISLLRAEHQMAIFEAGISKHAEMEKLERVLHPTLGILTMIGDAHSAFFSSEKEKLEEKLKLFNKVKTLIYCSNNHLIYRTLQEDPYNHIPKISWGVRPTDNYCITARNSYRSETHILLNNFTDTIVIPFIDDASIENAMHIVVMALHLRFSIAEINEQLQHLSLVNMRMEIAEALHHSIIINDTYSLDKNSLRIALQFLDTQTQKRNKTVIISDFEQNLADHHFYTSLIGLFKEHHITKLVTVGKHWQGVVPNSGGISCYHFHSTEELISNIRQLHIQEEAILVKGARSFQFERVVHALKMRKHRTVMQINLSALSENYNYYKKQLAPNTKIMGMVKAMSYGLGDVELVNELCFHDIDYLAVAYVDEGVALRERNVKTPIIVLGAEAYGFETMLQYQLEPEIFNLHYLQQFGEIVAQHPDISSYPIHIKVETGMHRLGFDEEDFPSLIELLLQYPQLKVTSIFSHLAAADSTSEDHFSRLQIHAFEKMAHTISKAFPYPIIRHLVNSAGITRFPEAHYDMVRLGLGLYGFSNVDNEQKALQHTVTLKSIVTQVKTVKAGNTIGYDRSFRTAGDMQIAIVPIGYADGYPRELSNGAGKMVIAGKSCPIIGKICMDMCMIDVTHINVSVGDEVIIYGNEIPIYEVAQTINKTPYELLTAITRRVQRVYIRE